MDFERALSVVYEALAAANELRAADDAVIPGPDVVLAGDDGVLDSLGLTTLILSIESRIHDITGREVSLLQGEDFEAQLERLRTPATIAGLIVEQAA
jgi:hypothetical protein